MKKTDRKIFIADNQDIARYGIIYILKEESDIPGIEELFSKKEITDSLKENPDAIIILDYSGLDFERIEELMILSERYTLASFLLVSDEFSRDFLKRVIVESGNFSVLTKDCTKDDLLYCLSKMINGDKFIPGNIFSRVVESLKTVTEDEKTVSHLTTSEKMILREIALGKTTKEIADMKNLSFHTINTHRKNIFREIGVNNVKEAIRYAIRAGIIDTAEYTI